MSTVEQLRIKETQITNNCPACYNQDLLLTFYQKKVANTFFNRTTKEISHDLACIKCGTQIYPVDWTPDIERVFDYYRKLAKPHKQAIKFSKLSYGLFATLVLLIGALIYFYFNPL